MKKFLSMILAFSMMISLAACGGTQDEKMPKNERQEVKIDYSTSDGILKGINEDCLSTAEFLNKELDTVNAVAGVSLEEYMENKQLVSNWYEIVVSESEDFFERTKENSIKYYKLLLEEIDLSNWDAIYDSFEIYYDSVLDETMEEYYDEICDALMEKAYDSYYDGVIDDGYDTVEYEIYQKELEEAYKMYFDYGSELYEMYLESGSYLYRLTIDMRMAFQNGEYDVDKIVEKVDAEIEKEQQEKEQQLAEKEDIKENENNIVEDKNNDEVSADFIALMDTYEEFFDDYIEFMTKYNESKDTMAMLTDYLDYLAKFAETMEAFEAIEGQEMTDAEALYYAEVQLRISQKLLLVLG